MSETSEPDGIFLFVSSDGMEWTTQGQAVEISSAPVKLKGLQGSGARFRPTTGLQLGQGFAIEDIAAEAERTQRFFALGERKNGVLMIRHAFMPSGAARIMADLLDRG